MFDMFRNMGKMAEMMRNLPKIQEEMGKMRDRVAQITAEGDAGAGMVKARFNGKLEMLSLTISDEAAKDPEMLATLVKAAVNQAIAKVQEAIAAESQGMAANLGLPGLPPGFQLPGMG
jgi:DNA-binding YbaB/EbfC family protein